MFEKRLLRALEELGKMLDVKYHSRYESETISAKGLSYHLNIMLFGGLYQ
jgi:hypothetical protein